MKCSRKRIWEDGAILWRQKRLVSGRVDQDASRRTLLSDIESLCVVRIVVSASEEFAENRVVWLLHTLRLDMPAGEIILQHSHEPLFGIVALFSAVSGYWFK